MNGQSLVTATNSIQNTMLTLRKPLPSRPNRWAAWLLSAVLVFCWIGSNAARSEQPPTAAAVEKTPSALAALAKPGPNDRQITLAVKSYLEREHFLRRPVDDEIARRWFGIFRRRSS